MKTRQYLGKGVTYAEHLKAEPGSDLREEWIRLSNLATALHLPGLTEHDTPTRSKTIDELMEMFADLLPEAVTIDDLARQVEGQEYTHTKIIYTLKYYSRTVGGGTFVSTSGFDTREEAEAARERWIKRHPNQIFIVVKTTTTTRQDVL